MSAECGLSPAVLASIGDTRIRQRMEACQQGMVQLDSLRQKHHKLMEQLRSQYPEFSVHTRSGNNVSEDANVQMAINGSSMRNLNLNNYDSTTLPSSSNSVLMPNVTAAALNNLNLPRCESPMSACMSHRSSVSMDSGYTSISSDPFLNISSSPMSYSAFKKKASTLDRVPHTSMMNPPQVPKHQTHNYRSKYHQKHDSHSQQQRPQSMYAAMSSESRDHDNVEEDDGDADGCIDLVLEQPKNSNQNNAESDLDVLAGVSVAATTKKLMNSSGFVPVPPTPTARKFTPINPPKPFPRTLPSHPQSSSSQNAARILSLSSSALHQPSSSTPQIRSSSRPPPQYAKYENPIHLQNAQVYAPIQPSSNSAFLPKKQSTPPLKVKALTVHQPTHQQQRAFIVPILQSSKNDVYPSRQRVIAPEKSSPLLNRQKSTESTVGYKSSPMEVRKLFMSTPHTISRYGHGHQANTTTTMTSTGSSSSRNRREKIWYESEGL